jgi:hypothetical protein
VVATLPLLRVVTANHVPVEGVAVLFIGSEEVSLPMPEGEARGSEVTLKVSAGPRGLEGAVNDAPVGIVQFQSCQGFEGVSEHGVGCVPLGQNRDVGTPGGIPPGFPLAADVVVIAVLLIVVEVELSVIEPVPTAVALVRDDEAGSEGDEVVDSLADEAVDDGVESTVVLLAGCRVELSVGIALEAAEMREELDHPVNDARVSLGEKRLVVLLSTTLVIVNDPDCGEIGPVAAPVLSESAVPLLELPGRVWFLLSGTVAVTVNSSGDGVTGNGVIGAGV